MRQNSKVSSALTAEAARWRDASISAWMSPSSADGAAAFVVSGGLRGGLWRPASSVT